MAGSAVPAAGHRGPVPVVRPRRGRTTRHEPGYRNATCRIRSLLLFGVLSLSPLLVVTQMSPSGLGSTVRSRPNWPWKNAFGVDVPLPWIVMTHSRMPRSAHMYSVFFTIARPLGDACATPQVRTGLMMPAVAQPVFLWLAV